MCRRLRTRLSGAEQQQLLDGLLSLLGGDHRLVELLALLNLGALGARQLGRLSETAIQSGAS